MPCYIPFLWYVIYPNRGISDERLHDNLCNVIKYNKMKATQQISNPYILRINRAGNLKAELYCCCQMCPSTFRMRMCS